MPTCRCHSMQRPRPLPRRRPPNDFGSAGKKSSRPFAHFRRGGCRLLGEPPLKRNVDFARLAALIAAVVVLAALVGCKSQVSGDVMATVDGRKIFRSDVDKYYENQVASAQQAPTGEQATALRLNILHQMIHAQIL